MNNKKTIGAVAVFCAVMLISTSGFAAASKTTTIAIKTKNTVELILQKLDNNTGLSNRTKQIIRVALFAGILLYIVSPQTNKHKIKAITYFKFVLIGVDAMLLASIIMNLPQKQNNTNATRG